MLLMFTRYGNRADKAVATMSDQEKLKKFITSRQSALERDRVTFGKRMLEIAEYVSPHREDIYGYLGKDQKTGSKIYDGTAVSAAVIATDGIHGYHVSPAFPWFKYQVNRKSANNVPAVRTWLDEIEYNIYQVLNRSNFYDEMWSYIYDGVTLGLAVLYPEEDPIQERMVFESVPPGECFVADNRYGEVDVLHRKRKLTAKKMVEMFGINKVTQPVKNSYENDPFVEYEVIHAVYPREEFDSRKIDKKNKPYASVWYLPAGNHLLMESGFGKFPYHVWRYLKTGKSAYGVGPASMAIADIITLNLMSKTILGAGMLAVDPAYNVPAYLLGKVNLMPRGLNYMSNPADRITPVNSVGTFPIGIDREQAKQQAIRERFHVDTFLMLSQMGTGQRTAYEVSEMMSEKAAILGAELGPLNNVLNNILEHIYEVEKEADRMPDPPAELIEMAQFDPSIRFDPVYMGPLAQSQRERFQKDGTRKFLEEIANVVNLQAASGIAVDVLDGFDLDAMSEAIAEANNLPGQIKRSKEALGKIRQGKMMAQQEQAQQEQAQAMAGGLKTMSEVDRNTGGKLSQGMAGMMGAGGPPQPNV
jgi:hypothetical protein